MEVDYEEIEAIRKEDRHKEVVSLLRGMANSLGKDDDAAILEAIKKQPDAIKAALNEFVGKLPKPEINVEVNNKEILSSFSEIARGIVDKITASNNEVIKAINSRPVAEEFDILLDDFARLRKVKINYKK